MLNLNKDVREILEVHTTMNSNLAGIMAVSMTLDSTEMSRDAKKDAIALCEIMIAQLKGTPNSDICKMMEEKLSEELHW